MCAANPVNKTVIIEHTVENKSEDNNTNNNNYKKIRDALTRLSEVVR